MPSKLLTAPFHLHRWLPLLTDRVRVLKRGLSSVVLVSDASDFRSEAAVKGCKSAPDNARRAFALALECHELADRCRKSDEELEVGLLLCCVCCYFGMPP